MLTANDFKIPELVRDVEQQLNSGDYWIEEENVIALIETLSFEKARVYQPEEIAEWLEVGVPPEEVEYDGGWDFLEEQLGLLADDITAKMGLPGVVYFGRDEHDGAFELYYLGDFEELEDIYGLKPDASNIG